MKRVVTSGRTVDEAVTSALVKLGVTSAQATVRVLAEPVKGVFGLFGGRPAEVEVCIRERPEDIGVQLLKELLRLMDVDARVEAKVLALEDEETIEMNIVSDSDYLPHVIGRHGWTLDSIQFWLNIAARQRVESQSNSTCRIKFLLDAGDYRSRRKEQLCALAERVAWKVAESGRSEALESMSAADRKVIHEYLHGRADVSTMSEGSEPNRRIRILPAEKR
jgi:spoIIIJ-associated protein